MGRYGRSGKNRGRGTFRLTGALVALGRILACCVLAAPALGQSPSTDRIPSTLNVEPSVVYRTDPGTCVLLFRVFAEKSSVPIDRQALLKLVNLKDQKVVWQTTEGNSQGAFTNVPFGNYDVEISAVGYLSTHQAAQTSNAQLQHFEIVLRRDPAAINLDVDDRALPSKARKEMKHGVSALKSRNLKDAEKHLAEAYKIAPSNAGLNFLLGYLYFQQRDYEKASIYLGTATKLRSNDGSSLTLLGRAYLERKDYPQAQSVLEQAVATDPESWLPHNLLADAYFHQKNYDKARDEAQVAIDKGKAEANPARLILGQALINLGKDEQGIQALEAFLQQSPGQPMAGQVRSLIAEVREHASTAPSADREVRTGTKLPGVDPLRALAAPGLSEKSWQPPGIDQVKVALAPGVACPSEKVAEETGKHVGELADDVARFSAIEDLFHQNLDRFGNPIRTETRKYNYVASISEPEPGFLAVDESRADKMELEGYPDKIASTGFAALALVFHPHMRDNFDIKCEGLGDWRGQASWIVYFKQRDDKPDRMHSYKVGRLVYPVKLKGRAWITADKFQIVRIESEMVRPMPEIKLLSEHQVVEYGPIRFDKKNMSLWLPKSAEIYFDFRQHHYYRRHSFDHYMLFSVDSDEKRKEPGAKPPVKPPAITEPAITELAPGPSHQLK
jgi:tetratricopeptide (TPR) repeat protein